MHSMYHILILFNCTSWHQDYVSVKYVCFQGTEIYTVYAKDGDVGNPNPIQYSIVTGELYNPLTYMAFARPHHTEITQLHFTEITLLSLKQLTQ